VFFSCTSAELIGWSPAPTPPRPQQPKRKLCLFRLLAVHQKLLQTFSFSVNFYKIRWDKNYLKST
jgi:hypothetical protein